LFLAGTRDFPQRGKSRSATRLRSAGTLIAGNLARSACVRPAPEQANPAAKPYKLIGVERGVLAYFNLDTKDIEGKMNKIVELEEFYSLLHLDYKNFKKNNKLSFLFAKEQIIRGKVMAEYTEIDLFLNLCLWFYFFPKKKRNINNEEHFNNLQRSKRPSRLYSYILEYTDWSRKLSLLKEIIHIPKHIENNVEKIISLRNKLAHFPRIIFQPKKSIYKDKNIFSIEGLKLFLKDSDEIQNFLIDCHFNLIKHVIK
jgi:hypothetical protein